MRINHRYEHLQQPPLEMAGAHAAVYEVYVGATFQAVEVVRLSVDMVFYILL